MVGVPLTLPLAASTLRPDGRLGLRQWYGATPPLAARRVEYDTPARPEGSVVVDTARSPPTTSVPPAAHPDDTLSTLVEAGTPIRVGVGTGLEVPLDVVTPSWPHMLNPKA